MSIEQLIPLGSNILATIAALATFWIKLSNKVDRQEEIVSELKRQINAVWLWKDDFEKTSAISKEKFFHDIARLDASSLVVNEQLKNIVLILQEIKSEISNLKKDKKE